MAAYSRLARRSQAKFQTMKLSPLSAPCAAAPAQSTVSTCRSLRFSPRSCADGGCVDKMAEPKSRDRSSSTESQLKFLGCTHYRRCNDNHYRCQQCRLNEGLTLCTEDSPCEVCKDWLPEAWQAQEKANEQKCKRKAAAAAKAAKKSQERDDGQLGRDTRSGRCPSTSAYQA